MQDFFIGRDIGHRISIMCEANITVGIDDTVQRHASQLEEVHFLPVGSRHGMVRVGQAGKWDFLLGPVLPEGFGRIGTHSQNLDTAPLELFIVIPPARQLRAAVRSHEAAQEGKHNQLAAEIG